MSTPIQKRQMSSSLKERLKHSGRYHRSPMNPCKNTCTSPATRNVFTPASMLSKMNKESPDNEEYCSSQSCINSQTTLTACTLSGSSNESTNTFTMSPLADNDYTVSQTTSKVPVPDVECNISQSPANNTPYPISQKSLATDSVNKISKETFNNLSNQQATFSHVIDEEPQQVSDLQHQKITISQDVVAELVPSSSSLNQITTTQSKTSHVIGEELKQVTDLQYQKITISQDVVAELVPASSSLNQITTTQSKTSPQTPITMENSKRKISKCDISSSPEYKTVKTTDQEDTCVPETLKLSGDSAVDTLNIKGDIKKLKASIESKEEALRELKLVKMYREKNNLEELEKSIGKWRVASKAALQELQMLMPEPGGIAHLLEESQ